MAAGGAALLLLSGKKKSKSKVNGATGHFLSDSTNVYKWAPGQTAT